MANRLELKAKLREILGSENTYFQPTTNTRMRYPAIVYSRDGVDNTHADDIVYKQDIPYEVILIDTDPDSEIFTKLSMLPKCKWIRRYTADNLYHEVFKLYY